MTSQEAPVLTESAEQAYPSTPAAHSVEQSHWSRNHGPILLVIALLTLLAGYGVIFFNVTEAPDNTRPLVPNNFVPDDDPSTLDESVNPVQPSSESESTKDTEPSHSSQVPEKQ